MTEAVDGAGENTSITYAEIHSELEEVRRILVDLTGTVERLSSVVASVSPTPPDSAQTEPPSPSTASPPSSPPAVPNPVDSILGETFGRPA